MKHIAITFFALVLSACAAPQLEGPSIHIGLSPAAQPAQAAVSACVPSIEGLSVSIDSVYPNVVLLDDYDFYIRLGEPNEAPAFVAQLASDEVVAVMSTANVAALDPTDLAEIFTGRIRDWDELGGADTINLWVAPEGDEVRAAFEANVLLGAPTAGWAKLAANPQIVLDQMTTDARALGLLTAAWIDPNAAHVSTGVMLPLLAIADTEPSGAARQILACLQGDAGQAALAEHYTPLAP